MKPYKDFIKHKKFLVSTEGFSPETAINPKLFPFQQEITKWAIQKGNAAVWADCGLGKTPIQLEIAQKIVDHTGKPALILAPLAVSLQTQHEGEKFDIPVNICKSHDDIAPGINIANYERCERFDYSQLSILGLDESSILKSYMGKIKQYLVNTAGPQVPYKFSFTATPAPNDHMELLNQAEFLGIMKSSMALAIWFINKTNELGGYRLKKHAEKSFWEWVSSWAVYLNSPSDLGFEQDGFDLPELHVHDHEITMSMFDFDRDDGSFLRDVSLNATSYNREKRHTLDARCTRTQEIVMGSPEKQFLIWVELNDEGQALRKLIPEATEVRGSDKVEKKEQAAFDFINGKIRVLIAKPSMFGYGLNFQNCSDTIFCGLSFSYEKYYQAVRRFWRFKQTRPVTVHRVFGSSEKGILRIVQQKETNHKLMQESMFGKLKDVQSKHFFKKHIVDDYARNEAMMLP